ncbi:MAG: MMPL family transporter [Myxococcales bacterium]|nr:MMPL family transporter [Myxococcales bacterium]MCB9533507.1 MMPL family transporter [Myxococcales bacterium]
MAERLAAFVSGRPFAALAIVASLAALAAFGVGVRGVKFDFTPQALFSSFDEQQEIDARFHAQFGSTENVALVLVRAPDVLDVGVLNGIHAMTRALEGQEFAARVESITVSSLPRSTAPGELTVDSPVKGDTVEPDEAQALRSALAASGLLDGTLVSESRHLAVVAVFLADGYERLAVLSPAVDTIEEVIAATSLPSGATAELAGLPHIRVYMIQCFRRDQMRLIPVSMLICGLILLWSFRWIPGVALPLAAVGLSAALTVGGMALFGEPFNIINQVVPTLIIVIGVSDSIHLVARFGEELRHGDRRLASRRTVATMAAACFLTSFTTAVGFGSLAASRTHILARFGVTAAVGVMLAYVVTILFLPVALSYMKPPRHALEGEIGWMGRATEACVRFSMRHAKAVLVVSAAVTALMGWYGSSVVIDTTLMEAFPESDPVYAQTRLVEEELSGVLPVEVSLTSEAEGRFDDPELLNALDGALRTIADEPQVLATRTYADVLHHTWVAYADDPGKLTAPFRSRQQVAQLASLVEGGRPDPIAPYVSSDRRHLRATLQVRDDGSRATLAMTARARATLDEALAPFGDVRVELSGDAYTGSLGLDALIRDMATSLGMAVVIIFAFMALLFRSLRMGLISVPANVIPLFASAAYMAARGFPLNTTTVIIFSVSLGLAVDDTIHLMARYREERARGASLQEAMTMSGRHSGHAVMVTSIMLTAGMSAMLVSSFNPVRLFGEIIALTIAACLVADLLVLPATMRVFGKD